MPSLTVPLSLPALVISAFLVSFATVAVPGPITIVAGRLALARHALAATWFLVGTTALDIALFSALAAGAAPALRAIGALPVVEIMGGAALLWGGLSSWRSSGHERTIREPRNIEGRSILGYVALGLAVSAANPHYWIWWVTAGLAFVEGARAHGASGLAWMLGALIGGVICWYVPMLWAIHRGRVLLSPRGERIVVRGISIGLIVLGVALVGIGGVRLFGARLQTLL